MKWRLPISGRLWLHVAFGVKGHSDFFGVNTVVLALTQVASVDPLAAAFADPELAFAMELVP